MKKSRLIVLLATMVLMTLIFVYIRLSKVDKAPKEFPLPPQVSIPVIPSPQQTPAVPKIAPAPLRKGNRSYYGTLPPDVDDIQDLRTVNKPSEQWQKRLEVNLKRLGGEKLKTMQVSPQESYIIPEGNEARYVERVIVKLESKDGEYTSFFAEVDSESGHVIKTWGVAIPEKHRHNH